MTDILPWTQKERVQACQVIVASWRAYSLDAEAAMWAIGVVLNPHYPWETTEEFVNKVHELEQIAREYTKRKARVTK